MQVNEKRNAATLIHYSPFGARPRGREVGEHEHFFYSNQYRGLQTAVCMDSSFAHYRVHQKDISEKSATTIRSHGRSMASETFSAQSSAVSDTL